MGGKLRRALIISVSVDFFSGNRDIVSKHTLNPSIHPYNLYDLGMPHRALASIYIFVAFHGLLVILPRS